jgi:hypothetical protein
MTITAIAYSVYMGADPARARAAGAYPQRNCQLYIAWVTAPPTAVRAPSITDCAPLIAEVKSEHKNGRCWRSLRVSRSALEQK